MFQVSVQEMGKLVIALDSGNGVEELDYTVVGRSAEGSQIVGMAIVTTTANDTLLSIRNPAKETKTLSVTPFASGSNPVSAHLVITKIQ